MNDKNIYIFTGHFGSGKTEIAINYARFLKKQHEKVAIVDLDIVNPYFRTKDLKEDLEKEGIKVVTSAYANTNIDLPSLPAEIFGLFQDKQYHIVLDVGGDDRGATALGRYKKYLPPERYQMFFVINTKRPLSSTTEDIVEIMHEVQTSARLQATGLINNTNLANDTTVDMLLKGQEMIQEVAAQTNVPITYITGKKEVLDKLPEDLQEKVFPIQLCLKVPWSE